jgi:nitric oxide synthase oxygenase domain/subunit
MTLERMLELLVGARDYQDSSITDEMAAIMAEAIDAHIAQHADLARDAARYRELLLLVGNKYAGETRHETAAKYLRQAEQQGTVAAQAMTGESP